MKTLRQLCTATLLSLVISLTALAGEIQTPGITNPPPKQTSETCNILAAQTETPSLTDADTVGEMTLTLMVSMLSVF